MFNYSKDTGAYPLYKAHKFDAGYDLSASETVLCPRNQVTLINTGVHIGIKPWQMAFVQPRSSTAKLGLLVITGTIDAGYTGAIKIQVLNFSDHEITVTAGQRVAQIVVHNNSTFGEDCRCVSPEILAEFRKYSDDRGYQGFGSSGA